MPFFHRCEKANKTAPITTPAARKIAIAMICSAVLAASAVLLKFRARMNATNASMPTVTIEPGSFRATQSKTWKGTNGNAKSFQPRYETAINDPVSRNPIRVPTLVAFPEFKLHF